MKYPERYLINFVDLYTQLCWQLPQLYDKSGSHQSIEMVKQPDLPNAPMTRWISYIAIFDYIMHHVPSQSHTTEDGLSRCKCVPEDSEEEDAEEYMDRFMGSTHFTSSSLSLFAFANALSSESLYRFHPMRLDQNFLKDYYSPCVAHPGLLMLHFPLQCMWIQFHLCLSKSLRHH